MPSGFGQGFSSNGLGLGGGFNFGFYTPPGAASPVSSGLYNNFDSYIINSTRELHSNPATAGQPGVLGLITRDNIRRTATLKVVSDVTIQGFKLVRTPEASGNWLTTTNDGMSVSLAVKSGETGSINGGALASKTFSTNSIVRSATRSNVGVPNTVNSFRTEYDVYTVYDASSVTLSAGIYTMTYWGVSTQIGVAALWTSLVSIATTTNIYPDSNDAAMTYYPVMQILSTAP